MFLTPNEHANYTLCEEVLEVDPGMCEHCSQYRIRILVSAQLSDLLNNLVPSRPATRISSSSPPGWKRRYGVILYTTPLNTLQASSRVLC